jgi:hypothetical protein
MDAPDKETESTFETSGKCDCYGAITDRVLRYSLARYHFFTSHVKGRIGSGSARLGERQHVRWSVPRPLTPLTLTTPTRIPHNLRPPPLRPSALLRRSSAPHAVSSPPATTHRFTRDLMLDAVPASTVSICCAIAICTQYADRGCGIRSLGTKPLSPLHDVPGTWGAR